MMFSRGAGNLAIFKSMIVYMVIQIYVVLVFAVCCLLFATIRTDGDKPFHFRLIKP
jgi:hypothetical protein